MAISVKVLSVTLTEVLTEMLTDDLMTEVLAKGLKKLHSALKSSNALTTLNLMKVPLTVLNLMKM